MNLEEAKIKYEKHLDVKHFECGCYTCEPDTDCYEAKGFLEGYEQGVRDAGGIQMMECRRDEFVPSGSSLKCEHMDRRDKIFKLLDEVKK